MITVLGDRPGDHCDERLSGVITVMRDCPG